MNRTQRMLRIADLVETREGMARRELAVANHELAEAQASLQSVFDQCREVAANTGNLSIAFGRALIESGWLTARDREEHRDVASAVADEKRDAWQHQRTRVDALGRLVDRLHLIDEMEAAKVRESELDDLINARFPAATVAAGAVGVGSP